MTRRFSWNIVKRAAATFSAAVALGAGLPGITPPARADVTSYSFERRQIKACVLVSDAASTTINCNGSPTLVKENAVPYVFYIMDKRTDLKPGGWEFVNPMAPSNLTGDIVQRWTCRAASSSDPTLSNPLFKIGAPLTKNMGAYWEVDLDTISADDLQQFDVVLLAYHNSNINFTPEERDKLRRYVDAGGTVWFEDEGNANITNGQFIVDLIFDPASPATGVPTLASTHHPLVNFPFGFSAFDIQYLGSGGIGTHHLHRNPNGQLANPRILVPIVWEGAVPLVSAGDFGGGHIVVSSAGIATGINSFVGGPNVAGEGGNSGAISGNTFLGVLPADLKFGYNLVAWTSSVPTEAVNARRSGSTTENIGSLLGKKFQTIPIANPTGLGSGSVIHKGVIFSVDGNNVLHAYDASPGLDLDNDLNADDGLPDYLLGAPYDEIWRVDLTAQGAGITGTTRVSTPTIVSILDITANPPVPLDMAVITASNGATLSFNAFPRNANGRLLTTTPLLWSATSPGNGDLSGSLVSAENYNLPSPSPTLSEGILFTIIFDPTNSVNNPWRVVPIDPVTGRNIFDNSPTSGTVGVAPSNAFPTVAGLPDIVGSLTVGYVRDAVTGALDKVAYAPSRPINNGAGGGLINGMWLSTRNEPMQPIDSLPNGQHVRFKATGERSRVPWFLPTNNPGAGQIDLRPVLYAVSNGTTIPLVYDASGTGAFTVTYEGRAPTRDVIITLNTPLKAGQTLFADYWLDWPDYAITPVPNTEPPSPVAPELQRIASRRFMVNSPIPNSQILLSGGAALTPQDYLLLNAGDYPPQDRIFAVHDQFNIGAGTTGQPRTNASAVAWMFSPHGPNDEAGQLTGPNGQRARLENSDLLMQPFVNGVRTPITDPVVSTDWEAVGAPAVANGVAYTLGFCHMKFPASPTRAYDAALIMALRANPDTTFQVKQADGTLVRIPSDGTLVTLQQLDLLNSRPGNPRYITLIEGPNFTVDRDSSTIHITDFRQQPNGDMFSTSQPIFVRIGATLLPDPVFNTTTGYGPLDNLLWWMIVPLTTDEATGAIGNSNIPPLPAELRDVNPVSSPTVVGNTLYYGTARGSIVSIDLNGIQANGGQAFFYKDANDPYGTLRLTSQPAMIDPQTGLKLVQPLIHPPLATTGIAAIGTPQGLVALDNQVTLIADNNRLLEVDRAGRAVLNLDATQSVALAGGTLAGGDAQIAATKISLSRPNTARRYTLNEYLVADTGNNRLVQMDRGGIVSLELHSFSNDMKFLRPNDPLTLNLPTDVQTYTDSNANGTIVITNPNTGVTYSYTGFYFATHYIIADSGNYRGLEIVDAIDASGNPITLTSSNAQYPNVVLRRQVIFVTRSQAEQNLNLRYRTMQQFRDRTGNTFMVAAVDNVRQGALDPGAAAVGNVASDTLGPGGSIMVIKRYPAVGKDGDVAALINSIAIVDVNNKIVRHQAITNPTFFREFEDGEVVNGQIVPTLKYLLADENGVYVLRPSGNEALVEWMLTGDDYYFMTGRRLRAASIQKLNQSDPYTNSNGVVQGFKPHYLITNRYTGLDNVGAVFGQNGIILPGEMHGEVVEVKGLDYYLSTDNSTNTYNGYRQAQARLYTTNMGVLIKNPISSVVWKVPNERLPGANPMGIPIIGPIRRSIGLPDGGTATYLLEQPSHSDRPF